MPSRPRYSSVCADAAFGSGSRRAKNARNRGINGRSSAASSSMSSAPRPRGTTRGPI